MLLQSTNQRRGIDFSQPISVFVDEKRNMKAKEVVTDIPVKLQTSKRNGRAKLFEDINEIIFGGDEQDIPRPTLIKGILK